MSLNIALNTAVSSLLVNEQQMAVTSSNIGNANTAGYTRKTAAAVTVVTQGVGTSVAAGTVSSKVDVYLLKDIAKQISTSAAASTTNWYYQSLVDGLGSVSSSDSTSSTDLSSALTSLSSALNDLESTPDSSSDKAQVVGDLDEVASGLRQTSSTIQSLRAEADGDIATTVEDVNTQLDTIAALNDSIVAARAAGQSTADLEDSRTTALQSVAADIGVTYYVDGSGAMRVYTKSGQSLIDEAGNTHSLSYTAAASVSTSTTYASGGFNGIKMDGTDITASLTTGKLGALISQRDTVLTNAQSELDNLASTLSSAFNSISNLGSASVPQNSLTGSVSVGGSTAVTVASGTTVRVALTDSGGDVTGYQDIDLSSCSTVDGVCSALQGLSGVGASVDGDGHLVLKATPSSAGIAVTTLSGSIGGTDLSSYFGLNDVFSDGTSAATIAVRSDLLSSSSLLPTGSLSDGSSLAAGAAAVAASSSTVVTKLVDALSSSRTFSASGTLGAIAATFSGYASAVISGVSTASSQASGTASTAETTLTTLQSRFSSESGVNTDEESANLVTLENNYAASAKVISTIKDMFDALISAVGS